MKLGRESEYALKGLRALAQQRIGATILLRDIAQAADVPETFLAKIFQKLAKAGVLQSSRGAVRGYALARPPAEIKLKDIFLVTEDDDILERCIFWSDNCADANPCPLHSQWKPVRRQILNIMNNNSLADVMRGRGAGRNKRRRRNPANLS
jgi:Rrf2 family transcriptional regulator, iron-sulfur cluster assembly transcription factor